MANTTSGHPPQRSPVVNPGRRLARLAVSMARVELRGTSGAGIGGAGAVAQSLPGPPGATGVHDDGSDITTFLTELDYTDSEYQMTVESTL